MRKDSGIVIPQADSAVRTTRSFDQSYVDLSPCDHVPKKEGYGAEKEAGSGERAAPTLPAHNDSTKDTR